MSAPAAMHERIDVAPVRAAVERSGVPIAEIARRLGWMRSGGERPDDSRLRRALGIDDHIQQWRCPHCGEIARTGRTRAQSIDRRIAEAIVEVIHVAPTEVDGL